MAGIFVAVLGIAVAVVAVIALQNPRSPGASNAANSPSPTPTSSVTPSHSSTASQSSPPASQTQTSQAGTTPAQSSSAPSGANNGTRAPVVVLNNTTIKGLAARVAQIFGGGGWDVTEYNNYQNDILSTAAYYNPDVAGARDAALELQREYPQIKRVIPQFDGLAVWNSPIVVILVSDWVEG